MCDEFVVQGLEVDPRVDRTSDLASVRAREVWPSPSESKNEGSAVFHRNPKEDGQSYTRGFGAKFPWSSIVP